LAKIALVLFASLLTVTFAAGGCSRKAATGFEPVFRRDYPGAPCKDLKVETGSYDAICSRSPAWTAACPFGWKDLENTQIAIVHGTYDGPICLLSHDDCDPPEKIDFVGAVLRIGNGNWDPGGQQIIDGRRVDVRMTLQVGCQKPTKPPG
jgi:hypothetical protein